MRKQYNIRWTDSDNQELSRVVKNFNAKISRLAKANPKNKNVLPEKVSVRQMRELIKTRQDLNRELNALKRFSQRGAEKIVKVPGNDYNLKTTKWQKEEMIRRIGVINRKRKQRLKEINELEVELEHKGKKLGYSKKHLGMDTEEKNSLKPMNAFSPKMTRNDLNYKFKHIINESQSSYWNARELLHKQNYIDSLLRNYPEQDIKDIIKKIEEMDYKEFRKIYDSDPNMMEWSYFQTKEQQEQYLNKIRSVWMPNK